MHGSGTDCFRKRTAECFLIKKKGCPGRSCKMTFWAGPFFSFIDEEPFLAASILIYKIIPGER